jgi:transcriptional regulator with XRE-family HTH domain
MAALEQMGAAFRRLRELTGLDRREVAMAAGVSASSVGSVENGKAQPRRAFVERLVRVLADVLLADVLELGADAFAPPADPEHAQRVEQRRNRDALSTRAVRRRRDLRRALDTGDPATIADATASLTDRTTFAQSVAEALKHFEPGGSDVRT